MALRFAPCLFLLLSLAARAQNTQICGWVVESNQPADLHRFELWLRSDVKFDFLYQIGGEGVVTPSGKSHSPASGTYSLEAGKAERVWGFGTTLNPPAKIDLIVEVHQTPADIFSDAPTPLLAKFSFRRDVPKSETKAPAALAAKQCAALKKREMK